MADETDLRLYPVERDLRGLSAAQMADAHRALGEPVRRAIRRGSHIRHVPRIWALDERRCLGLSGSAGRTRSAMAMDVAQVPLARMAAVLSPARAGRSPVADREQDRRDDGYRSPDDPEGER